MTYAIHVGDCREVLPLIAADSVHACVTDPPYGLGFMGKDWDHGIPGPHFWQEVYRVLKPGAHLVAFGGTRTFHRLTCAIEDAGFEIRDCLGWIYGSGFPKSLDVSKAIDKAAGAERVITRAATAPPKSGTHISWDVRASEQREQREQREQPATAEAAAWTGWGTALKPAWEPIILARKPLQGTVAANVQEHGTGALNIDGCRVNYAGTEDAKAAAEIRSRQTDRNFDGWGMKAQEVSREAYLDGPAGLGRWPANICHDGSEEVLAVFPETESGTGAVKRASSTDGHGNRGAAYGSESRPAGLPMVEYGDKGSAARFFYCAKASRQDRNEGLSGFRELVINTDTPPGSQGSKSPRADAGRGGATENHHPTVKPTDLMRWLCRLITPKGGTVLDPFMGSGSTGKAADIEGFDFIGIELDPEYAEIAKARITGTAPLFAQVSA